MNHTLLFSSRSAARNGGSLSIEKTPPPGPLPQAATVAREVRFCALAGEGENAPLRRVVLSLHSHERLSVCNRVPGIGRSAWCDRRPDSGGAWRGGRGC